MRVHVDDPTAEMTWRSDEDRAWAVEEACRNARPSPLEIGLGGWMLRRPVVRRGGRIRSNPLRGWRDDPALVIAEAETVYPASVGL